MPSPLHIAVVGGGISGLAAAHRLVELSPGVTVTLLEAGPRLGGTLQTEERDGFLVERSADNFITNVPWGIDLCRRLGIADELQSTDETRRRALVVCEGRLEPVPEGFVLMSPGRVWPVVTTPILSIAGKLRLAWELFVPPRTDTSDESLASFATRRLGQEAYERLVQPLIGGIYTADPHKLSMAATLPRFQQMEREHGSLLRAAMRTPANESEAKESGARYGMFVAPKSGMARIVGAIAERLPPGTIRLNTPIAGIRQAEGGGWQIVPAGHEPPLACDAVIVALPAPAAAKLLGEVDAGLPQLLGRIAYAGASLVITAHRREHVKHPLDGFGFVVPAIEHRKILACSFTSVKFPGRAPEGTVLLRTFVGGALQPELAELPDARLKRLVLDELRDLLGIHREPLWSEVARWESAMPQYHVGHVERMATLRQEVERYPGLELCGNAYEGVGVPACIHSGEQAAERVLTAARQQTS